MGQEFEKLDLAQSRDGELFLSDRISFAYRKVDVRTPSFSWCMMIFFNATVAPVFFDRAR